MLGKIEEILDNQVKIKLEIDIAEQPNLVNLHVVFDDGTKRKIVAEVANVDKTYMYANIVGEINDGFFVPGGNTKPSFKSKIRIIEMEELELIFGKQETQLGYTNFGTSNVYDGYKINVAINEFFNGHFSILGNSGAGKSCTVASILQKLFISSPTPPIHSALFFFDAYGEYTHAFGELHNVDPRLGYKAYTTNIVDPDCEILRIPVWLLDVDDMALLLDAQNPSQLPIIEKTLKLVRVLTGTSENVVKRKNDIIARAVQDILLSGDDSTKIRDQVIGVMTKFNTPSLNLETQIVQPGYTRTFKQCLFVDKTGKMQEMELVVEFIRGYILEEEIVDDTDENPFYTLNDLELAMDFALINEGILKSNKVYDNANVMSVRLHTLATGDNRHYFTYPDYITMEEFVNTLTTDPNSKGKVQIVNFNINYVDDRIAKVMTKIISRMLFNISSTIKPRGSKAFHIIIEEAHRYVQHDSDIELLGYNIFERIAKEGRKYGMFLGLITQRPSELSDTCVSQCMNFVILRTMHPVDLQYIKEMVPSVSAEIVLQLKNLKPGNCIAFGSAFKVPTTMHIDLPNPRPLSNNVDLEKVWYTEYTATDEAERQHGSLQDINSQPNPADNAATAATTTMTAANTPAPIAIDQNSFAQQVIQANQQAATAVPQQQVVAQNVGDTQVVNPTMLTPVG